MPVTASVIIERDRELGTLTQSIAAAAAGQGHLVLIDGPAGIGKTQLMAELRTSAAPSMTVRWARASELERDYPFGVVRQLFEALLTDPGQRAAVLAGAATAAEAVFGVAAPGDSGPESGSFATLHGLYWLSLNLAEQQPLLLAVDDIQWADRESLRFLAYLTHRLDGERILVAATRRSSDPGTDPALLADIAHDPQAVLLHPRPLSAFAVRDLVRARLGADADPSFCDECHVATGGNPLLLRQLLTALEADGVQPRASQTTLVGDIGARAVSRSVIPRLSRLPGPARAVARAIAVLGGSAGLPAVAALAGVSEPDVAQATAELARAEILDRDPPLRFVHPLVRDAVYDELSPTERQLEHTRAATLLRDAGAPEDQIATQLLKAPPRGTEWVADLLHRAGLEAKRKSAADSAVAYLRRALAEPPPAQDRARVLADLGMAETVSNAQQAIEDLSAAYALAGNPLERAEIAKTLARLWFFSPTPQRGLELAREAAALIPPGHDDAVLNLTAVQYLAVHFGAGDRSSLRELERYRDGVDAPGPGARMLEAVTAFTWMLDCGPAGRCSALALRALGGGQLIGVDESFLVFAAMSVLIAAGRDEALPLWDSLRAATRQHGSLIAVLGTTFWSGFTLARRGDLAEGEALMRQADVDIQLMGMTGPSGQAYGSGILAELLVERGDLAGAEQVLAAAPPAGTAGEGENYLRSARAAWALATGNTEAALAAAEDWRVNGAHNRNPAWFSWRSHRALALSRAGRTAEAVADATEEVELGRRFGAPGGLGRALRVLGVVSGDEAALREAVDVLAASPARLEYAQALAALGSALRRSRRPGEAREPLRTALDLAAACGAAGLAQHVRSELHAAGVRPRSEALSGVDALTPSERRVATMAADGAANKSIAQTLYVTPKTVELHLSAAYRKLGIRSRRELPAALARR
jgi:DNA-binding CsgD family transcriptional regulator